MRHLSEIKVGDRILLPPVDSEGYTDFDSEEQDQPVTILDVQQVYEGGAKLVMYERRYPLDENDCDRLGECTLNLPSYDQWNIGDDDEESE